MGYSLRGIAGKDGKDGIQGPEIGAYITPVVAAIGVDIDDLRLRLTNVEAAASATINDAIMYSLVLED